VTDKLTILGAVTRLAQSKLAHMGEAELDVFVSSLIDIPAPLVVAACERLSKADTYGMPDAGKIRATAQQVSDRELSQRALPPAPGEKTYHCANCHDDPNAWLFVWCPGYGELAVESDAKPLTAKDAPTIACHRDEHHPPHTYCERCACHRAPWREERRRKVYTPDTPASVRRD
jgi:hypothetical protein